MTWIIDNWFIIIALLALGAGIALCIIRFFEMPREQQIEDLKEWLLLAVIEAEKALGGGTGNLKLRMCYSEFIKLFPWLVKVITFAQFSMYVDEALEKMKKLLESNKAVKNYVEGEAS